MKVLISILTFNNQTFNSQDELERKKDHIPEALLGACRQVLDVDTSVKIVSALSTSDVDINPEDHYFFLVPPVNEPFTDDNARAVYQEFFKDWVANSNNIELHVLEVAELRPTS